MGGSSEWDSRMMDSLNNFNLSSPEVKQQFGKLPIVTFPFHCFYYHIVDFVNIIIFLFCRSNWSYT